jgi:anti-sigma factor RsiW
MISCSEAVEQLWRYLEKELPEARRSDIEEHLAFCRRCCGELEFAEELRRFLADAARPRLPVDVEGRLSAFLHDLEEAADAEKPEAT